MKKEFAASLHTLQADILCLQETKAQNDQEGRVLTAEFPDFYLLTVYTPNSGSELARLPYREAWDREFLAFTERLRQKKPLLMCGDFNVAHREVDLARPRPNDNRSAGYTQKEIEGMDRRASRRGPEGTWRLSSASAAEPAPWVRGKSAVPVRVSGRRPVSHHPGGGAGSRFSRLLAFCAAAAGEIGILMGVPAYQSAIRLR